MAVHLQNKHVALFLPSLRGGGAEKVMQILANEFAAKNMRVDLLLSQAEGPYLSKIDPRVKIWAFGKQRVATCLPALVRYLRKEKPQAVLTALYHANIAAVVARLFAQSSTRLVLSEHTTPSQTRSTTLRDRLSKNLIRWFYPLADAVVAVSRGVSDDLGLYGIPPERKTVVYNPIIASDFVQQSGRPCFNSWLNGSGVPAVIGVGRLEDVKGFDILLKAFALARRTIQCRLLLVGEGSRRESLRELAIKLGVSEHVQLVGFVANPYPYIKKANLLVVPSRWEGFGNVVVEALACGTRVLSTDCPGPREILQNGKLGKLVPVDNVELLADALKECLIDPATQQPVDPEYIDSFSVERSVRCYLRVLFA
jgi:glycosyltransferase involved in cell wall biosynthesis